MLTLKQQRILAELQQRGSGLTARSLAELTGIPLSYTRACLTTLQRLGQVRRAFGPYRSPHQTWLAMTAGCPACGRK